MTISGSAFNQILFVLEFDASKRTLRIGAIRRDDSISWSPIGIVRWFRVTLDQCHDFGRNRRCRRATRAKPLDLGRSILSV